MNQSTRLPSDHPFMTNISKYLFIMTNIKLLSRMLPFFGSVEPCNSRIAVGCLPLSLSMQRRCH